LLEALAAAGAGQKIRARKVLHSIRRTMSNTRRCWRALARPACRPAPECLELRTLRSDVLGWSGGNAGNANSLITPANISNLTAQYSVQLDGFIYAEPLSTTVNVTVGPERGTHTLVLAATEHDTLYALDSNTGTLLWQLSLLGPGQSTLPTSATHFGGELGVTSTPVIDKATNTIYVVSAQSYVVGSVNHYAEELHAIDLSDGLERAGSPVVIADTGYLRGKPVSFTGPQVTGKGVRSVRGLVQFDVSRQLQRAGLALVGNNVVFAFGTSGGDRPPFHGWILAYDKNTLQRTGVFNDTPNGSDGGIWNSGSPIRTDLDGFLYTATGNGTFDTRLNRRGFPSRGDYGNSVLKLALVPGYKSPNGTGFKVVDYYTPSNQRKLGKTDGDLASSGVLILPNGWGGPSHPNLLLASGKSGTVYVINRDDMSKFHKGWDPIVQTLPGALTSSFDTPDLFGNTVFYAGVNDTAKSFTLVNGRLVQSSQTAATFPYPGASPVVSSDGPDAGIVWLISSSNQIMAYDPMDLSKQLWSAVLPGYTKFTIPAITDDGHVVVGAGYVLVGFGLA
jgi:hypothetical protein